MMRYLGWVLAFAGLIGTYWVFEQGRKREIALLLELQAQQQLVAQVSNRLAVVEAQYANYKQKQEREAREREQRERELRERDLGARTAPSYEKPVTTSSRPVAPPEETLEEAPREEPVRRSGGGRSLGDGINSLIDRLRDSFNQ